MPMTRAWMAVTALTLALGGGEPLPAFAQSPGDRQAREVESRILNVNGELIQLADGTVIRIPHGLALQTDIREGRKVKVRYQVKEGQPVATSIEMAEEATPAVRKQ